MEERSSATVCERGNDLIAFLYGELNEREAQDFERHLLGCRQCKLELGGFKQIRGSIIAWRQESLGEPTASVAGSPGSPAILGAFEPRKPSATVAIREFFTLSPLWLKGAVAFASILFCVAAVLAVARLFDKSAASVAANDSKRYTEEEVAAKIKEAVESKLRELGAEKSEAVAGPTLANDNSRADRRSANLPVRPAADSSKTRRRPLTKAEREQLAADLRLTSPKDETAFDLMGDRINQQQ
jgi:hypothetical protein